MTNPRQPELGSGNAAQAAIRIIATGSKEAFREQIQAITSVAEKVESEAVFRQVLETANAVAAMLEMSNEKVQEPIREQVLALVLQDVAISLVAAAKRIDKKRLLSNAKGPLWNAIRGHIVDGRTE